MKKLSEMTLEELWQLFPIILREHDDRWQEWFADECDLLAGKLPADAKIHHIGSTAVKTIWAKPIVDILVEVNADELIDTDRAIIDCGYRCMCKSSARIDYNKGYTENGFAERVFHLHLRVHGDRDEVYFRDYLNSHADVAKEYEALKLSLWKKYEHDRDAYTNAKGEFVRHYTEIAKAEKKVCPCKRSKCPRHGDCVACHARHNGRPTACERPTPEQRRAERAAEREKTGL